MAKQKTYKGQWGSDVSEAKFRAKEAVLWERAAPPPKVIDVATRFGSTRAYRWPGTGPAVVMLHGMTDTSVRWIRYGEALTEYDVYALDVMGEVGHSVPEVGFTSADDYATWLADALDGLGIAHPHLVGASLGGYIAFAHAAGSDTVASLVGLEPVGIVKLRLARLMRWSLRCGLAAYRPESMRRRSALRLHQPLLADKDAMAVLLQAQRGHPIKIPPLPVFTDERLRSITAPTYVLAGDASAAFDVDDLVQRINIVVPHGHASILPEAGHALSDSHFDDCLATIRQAIAAAEETS